MGRRFAISDTSANRKSLVSNRSTIIYSYYGDAALQRLGQRRPRVPALEKAYDMLPGREDIAMNLLTAYARVGEQKKATELVDNLVHRGESDATVARAREILFQADYNAAVALVRKRKLDEAATLLRRVDAESTTPALKQRAEELLARIGR